MFDLDGTLVDTEPTLEWAINTAFDDVGLPTLHRGAARQHIGHGLDHFVHSAMREVASTTVGERLLSAVAGRFHALLLADPWHGASPRRGAVVLLEQLVAHLFRGCNHVARSALHSLPEEKMVEALQTKASHNRTEHS
ncbi:MAG: HAD hydrolase-like protein, partial [Actinomycetota bacterium]